MLGAVRLMSQLTTEEYARQQAACDNLCIITPAMVEAEPELMRCVTCPFCKQLVDAILTPASISCPACLVMVDR